MTMHEDLELSQAYAKQLLVEQVDHTRGIPVRASGHTDLWPGDRWSEAYVAIGEPDLAIMAAYSIARSLRPDGAFPHLMQGTHKRGGIETNWIDRQVYRLQGNGALHLPNGEWVTESLATPTQALSALAIHTAGLPLPGRFSAASLEHAQQALWEKRVYTGLIATKVRDELTNSNGHLYRQIKEFGRPVIDPAINALFVLNGRALTKLPGATRQTIHLAVEEELLNLLHDARQQNPLAQEEVLAAARLAHPAIRPTEAELADFFKVPTNINKHPERDFLPMAARLEVARLLPDSEESQNYLRAQLAYIGHTGTSAVVRFEQREAAKGAVKAKVERSHTSWLPTAAEIVQLTPDVISAE